MEKKKKARIEIDPRWGMPSGVADMINNCSRFQMKYIRESAVCHAAHIIMISQCRSLDGEGFSALPDPGSYRKTARRMSKEVLMDLERYRNDVFTLSQIVQYHIVADELIARMNV